MDPTTGPTATLTHFLPASLPRPKTLGKSVSPWPPPWTREPPACSRLPPSRSPGAEAQRSPRWPRRAFWVGLHTWALPTTPLPARREGGGVVRGPRSGRALVQLRGWCLPPWRLLETGKAPDLRPGPHRGSLPIRIWRRPAAPQHRCHTARGSASGTFRPAARPPRSLTGETRGLQVLFPQQRTEALIKT